MWLPPRFSVVLATAAIRSDVRWDPLAPVTGDAGVVPRAADEADVWTRTLDRGPVGGSLVYLERY